MGNANVKGNLPFSMPISDICVGSYCFPNISFCLNCRFHELTEVERTADYKDSLVSNVD